MSMQDLASGVALWRQVADGIERGIADGTFAPGEKLPGETEIAETYRVNRHTVRRALATLAYDCRRADKFRGELLAALRIVDRGDMSAAQMRGAWAGEIGQTQFLPSSYLKYAVDYDGNGHRDLIHSVPDAMASTANYLKGYGWQAGQPWGEGSANFQVLLQWNSSQVYTKTVAYFAQQLAQGQEAQ